LHDVKPRAGLERDLGIGMARLLDRDLWDAGDGDGSLPAAEERIGMDHGSVRLRTDPRTLPRRRRFRSEAL
jgi:hypothetical protein